MKTNVEMTEQAERELKWFIENGSELRKDFEGKAVAIKDQRVIASAESGVKLWNLLKEKGIDDSEVLFEYIPPKGEITIY